MSAPVPLRIPATTDVGTEREREAFKLAVDMSAAERARFDLAATYLPDQVARRWPDFPHFLAKLRRSGEAERIVFAERQAKRIVLSVLALLVTGILGLIILLVRP